MIKFIVIGLAFLVFILTLICVMQRGEIVELRDSLKRMGEMYRSEADRNLKKLHEEMFRDDLELLNRWL